MSIQFVERRDDVTTAVFSRGLASTVFLFERDGRVFYTLPGSDEIEEMGAEDVVRFARLMGDAVEKQGHVEPEPHYAQPMTGMIEQLKQLITPVWDGDLICKDYRTKLHEAGLADKASGFNFLTAEGIRLCVLLQLLK